MKKNEARRVAGFRQETVKLPAVKIRSGGRFGGWVHFADGFPAQIDAVKESRAKMEAQM